MTRKNRGLRALLALLFVGVLGLSTVACEDDDLGDKLEDVGDEIEDVVD